MDGEVMTNEEAKDYIRAWCPYDRQEEIIKALSNSDKDCISRAKALAEIEALKKIHFDRVVVLNKVSDSISALPSIQPKPKMGHWEQYGYSWEDKFKCSECGKEQPKILCGERIIGHWSDYCPNCGADMRESEDA